MKRGPEKSASRGKTPGPSEKLTAKAGRRSASVRKGVAHAAKTNQQGKKSTGRSRKAGAGEGLATIKARLREAEATIEAIRTGQVDALVVQGALGDQVFTLKGADHRYRQLVESMNEGALLLTEDGTIVYGNARFARLVKVPLEKLIGSSFRNRVAESARRTVDALLQAPGAASRAEVEMQASDGTHMPVYLSVTDSWDEDTKLTCVIATDLAEQKRYQEIVAAERLAALIVDQAAEGIVVCDVEGRVVRASHAADRVAGRNPLLQRFEEVFRLVGEDGALAGRTLVDAALRGETVSALEANLVRGEETHVLLLSAGPILSSDKEPLGCVVSFVDITDRKRAAEERLMLLDRANLARVEAEAANRAKDEFLAMLGHELRNPLAPILTALQLMRTRSDDSTRREREIIERQVKHVVTLVDDLLDVSRITRGKVELDRRRIEVGHVVNKAVELASPLIEARHHQLQVEVEPNLWLDADEIRICQVLTNLLTNAAKYTEEGGRIVVRAWRDDGEIVIVVADNGVGISSDIMPGLFDMFVQGSRTIDRSEGGLGLGLAIVRSLVTLHGGKVCVRSAGLSQGSEFEVRFPAAEARASATDGAGAAALPKVTDGDGRRRILIVDDNVDAADMMGEALADFGHQTYVAYDGATALAAAAQFAPDLALLDIGLPVMDGFELARRLRSDAGPERKLRLIALTGYGQESDRRKTAAAGFDAHLVKPVDLSALARVIRGFSQ
ncbi:MAG TPA: ATP-binding protein [Polyangia bacterium]